MEEQDAVNAAIYNRNEHFSNCWDELGLEVHRLKTAVSRKQIDFEYAFLKLLDSIEKRAEGAEGEKTDAFHEAFGQ